MAFLIALIGLPGTGKTTLGMALGKSLDAEFIEVDKQKHSVARRLLGDEEVRKIYESQSSYPEPVLEQIYMEILKPTISGDASVPITIVEACLFTERLRAVLTRLAKRAGVQTFIIETTCSEDVALARLANRVEGHPGARPGTYFIIRDRWEDITNADAVYDTTYPRKGAAEAFARFINGKIRDMAQ